MYHLSCEALDTYDVINRVATLVMPVPDPNARTPGERVETAQRTTGRYPVHLSMRAGRRPVSVVRTTRGHDGEEASGD
jgi:hypothetical protein